LRATLAVFIIFLHAREWEKGDLLMTKHLSILSLSLFAFSSHASDFFHLSEISEADEASANRVVSLEVEALGVDLLNMKFEKTTLRALDFLFERAAQELQSQKLEQDAVILLNDWERFKAGNLALLDLGDREPLSQWLALRYDWLESKLGERLMNLSKLSDIKIFNFAIPVVYRPWVNEWDMAEYRAHFVPYAGASAYWVARGACGSALSFPASLLCNGAARGARDVTTTSIAPPLSDEIYKSAH
jgi:hypothetical protein